VARYCFFADYEVRLGDRCRRRGQTTLVHEVPDEDAFDPAEVLMLIRERIAREHGVDRPDVHLHMLSRL